MSQDGTPHLQVDASAGPRIAKTTPKKHLTTPTKAKISVLYRYHSQSEIADIVMREDGIRISQSRISQIIRDKSSRRVGSCPEKPETRGRKKKTATNSSKVERAQQTNTYSNELTLNVTASTPNFVHFIGQWEYENFREAVAERQSNQPYISTYATSLGDTEKGNGSGLSTNPRMELSGFRHASTYR